MDDDIDKDREMPEVNTNQNCSEAKTNGHISPIESLKNGIDSETSSNSDTPVVPNGAGSSITFSPAPAINHQPVSPEVDPSAPLCNSHLHNHDQGSSPNRITSPQHLSRCESPHDQQTNSSSPPNHQHVVHVHVNPGETFSVRVGDQIQHIQGRSFMKHSLHFRKKILSVSDNVNRIGLSIKYLSFKTTQSVFKLSHGYKLADCLSQCCWKLALIN